MCELDRCTVSRFTFSSPILSRVWRARRSRASFFCFMLDPRLLLLRFLDDDDLVGVPHALALVGLGRTVGADLGRHLPHLLLVQTLDQNLGLGGGFHLHALG